tara:strand:+ start:5611 stop:6681 length:1071 start_codon:yes stop_codon:yes gene_type:complete
MTVDRSGLSRRVRNRDDFALTEFGVPKPNVYANADAGSLLNIPSRSYDNGPQVSRPMSLNDAIQNISNQYRPASLTKDDVTGILDPKFTDPEYNMWAALFDPTTGNTLQSKFQAAGGGDAGLMAALGLSEEEIYPYASDVTSGVTSGGGGGGGVDPVAYAKAINDYIASLEGAGTDFDTLQTDLADRYAGYGQNLAGIADAATARQEASAARAAEALAAIDPQAAFQFNVDPASMGSGAALGYLESIGASTAGVEGLKGFEQSLLNQSLDSARQFSEAQQSALDIERAARQAAVPQILQETQGALEANRLAATLGLSEEERRALEAMLTRKSAEQQSIAEKILNARLAAAEAGVTL